MSQKFCNSCIYACFQNKLQELEGIELMLHPANRLKLTLSEYSLFQSMAHFLHFNKQEELEASVKEFFCFKRQELVSVWNQRTSKKVASDGATWWPLLLILSWIKQISYQKIAKLLTHPSIHLCISQSLIYCHIFNY